MNDALSPPSGGAIATVGEKRQPPPCGRDPRSHIKDLALKLGPDVPKLRKKHDLQHAAEIGDTRSAAGAALETDDPLDRRHMVEAPAAEIVLEIDQLLGELIELPMLRGSR